MTPPKGSKVKYLNFAITKAIVNIFAETLHTGRAAIDMKHIKRDFSLMAWVLPTDTPSTQGVGSKGQTISFSESSHVAYQIKADDAGSNMVATW